MRHDKIKVIFATLASLVSPNFFLKATKNPPRSFRFVGIRYELILPAGFCVLDSLKVLGVKFFTLQLLLVRFLILVVHHLHVFNIIGFIYCDYFVAIAFFVTGVLAYEDGFSYAGEISYGLELVAELLESLFLFQLQLQLLGRVRFVLVTFIRQIIQIRLHK